MPPSFLQLTEYGTFTGVSFDAEGVSVGRDGEDDVLSHSSLQFLEGLVLHLSPCPLCLFGELHEHMHNLGVVLDELPVEVREAQKQL